MDEGQILERFLSPVPTTIQGAHGQPQAVKISVLSQYCAFYLSLRKTWFCPRALGRNYTEF